MTRPKGFGVKLAGEIEREAENDAQSLRLKGPNMVASGRDCFDGSCRTDSLRLAD